MTEEIVLNSIKLNYVSIAEARSMTGLRLILGEYMDRMDREYKLRAVEAPLCKVKPSEYIRSGRIYFSCEADESLLSVVASKIGEDVLLYASDYPHWDMDYPDSAQELWERNDLSERLKRKILGENALRVYGLD